MKAQFQCVMHELASLSQTHRLREQEFDLLVTQLHQRCCDGTGSYSFVCSYMGVGDIHRIVRIFQHCAFFHYDASKRPLTLIIDIKPPALPPATIHNLVAEMVKQGFLFPQLIEAVDKQCMHLPPPDQVFIYSALMPSVRSEDERTELRARILNAFCVTCGL